MFTFLSKNQIFNLDVICLQFVQLNEMKRNDRHYFNRKTIKLAILSLKRQAASSIVQ